MDNSSLTGEAEPLSRTVNMTSDNPMETKNLAFYGKIFRCRCQVLHLIGALQEHSSLKEAERASFFKLAIGVISFHNISFRNFNNLTFSRTFLGSIASATIGAAQPVRAGIFDYDTKPRIIFSLCFWLETCACMRWLLVFFRSPHFNENFTTLSNLWQVSPKTFDIIWMRTFDIFDGQDLLSFKA